MATTVPACGQTCINNMLGLSAELGCPNPADNQINATCLCDNQNFGYGIRDCAAESCTSPSDYVETVEFILSYCQSAVGSASASSAPGVVALTATVAAPATTLVVTGADGATSAITTFTSIGPSDSTIGSTTIFTGKGGGGGSSAVTTLALTGPSGLTTGSTTIYTAVGSAGNGGSSSTPRSSATGAASMGSTSATPTVPASNTASPSPGLSTSAKIGIGVGVGAGVPLLLAFLAACFLGRRRRRLTTDTGVSGNDINTGGVGKKASKKRWDKPELEANALPRMTGRAELEGDSRTGSPMPVVANGKANRNVGAGTSAELEVKRNGETRHMDGLDEKERVYEMYTDGSG